MKRDAVTLFELLVALSLASLLVLALAGVLQSLIRETKRVNPITKNEWKKALDQILWKDLSEASGVAVQDGALALRGGASDRTASRSEAWVQYELRPTAEGRFALTRTVILAPSPEVATPSQAKLTQTLLWDVDQAIFERIDDSGETQPIPRVMGPTPRGIQYHLWFSNSATLSSQVVVR